MVFAVGASIVGTLWEIASFFVLNFVGFMLVVEVEMAVKGRLRVGRRLVFVGKLVVRSILVVGGGVKIRGRLVSGFEGDGFSLMV